VSRVAQEQRRWTFLLLSLALVHGLIYAAVVPPWQGPDETGHLEYAWVLVRLGRVPGREDLSPSFEQELLASLYEWRYGEFTGSPLSEQMPTRTSQLPDSSHARYSRPLLSERFSLAYVWQALFLLPLQHQDLALQLFVARLSSVLLNVAIVWLAFLSALELFPSRRELAVLMAAVVLFVPQHTFVNSTVGDGALAELMACLVVYSWILAFRRGLKVWNVGAILVATAIGVWTKNTAAFLIPANLGLAVW